jgi:hypothetical protein
MTTLRLRMLTLGIQALTTTALFANRYPRAVLTMLAGIPAGLAILGAVSLISDPAVWKFYLFAAMALGVLVWIRR